MHILPITSAKPHSRPNFQARVPKPLVKQMLGKTDALANLEIKTAKGLLFTVPATVAAKLYAKDPSAELDEKQLEEGYVKTLPSQEELAKMDNDVLVTIAGFQDEEGKTIFHLEENMEPMRRFFDVAPDKVIAKTFIKTDNNNNTAYIANKNEKMQAEMANHLQFIAGNGSLSIEESLELLKTNQLNKNLIDFMEARKTKKGADSFINSRLYEQILKTENDKVDVETEDGVYSQLPIEDAAKFFVENKRNSAVADLDAEYLANKAPAKNLTALLNSAFSSERVDCIDDICKKWESKDHQFIDIMISIIDVSTPKAAHMGVIRDYIQMENIDKFKDFYTKPDKYGRGLMHYAALRSPEEFEESILLLDQLFSYDDLDEVMLMHDKKGKIPAQMSDNAAITAFEYFKARPELIAEMLLSKDNQDGSILQNASTVRLPETAFRILQTEPEKLAEILSMNHEDYGTVYLAHAMQNSHLAPIFEDKIVELATDSDLPVEQSIKLLEANNLHPQIVEFLQMHNKN